MKKWESSIFFDNEELPKEDEQLFKEVFARNLEYEERVFFEKMHDKECGEFAPSADLIISETDNEDQIFLVRYYFNEYKIGKVGVCLEWPIYGDSLSCILNEDLYPLLSRHVTLMAWLREQKYECVKYDGNYAIK